ncbi:hypothetical protein RIF29_06317 [Crotalaria pallida]|uniref:Uncharacterized protein n=1 Tax=Crotalaria pallida TaxID=3830 RepID=A0AAN9J4K7_CROPI
MRTSAIIVTLSFSFACLLIGITAGADPEPVLDTSGQKVRRGVNYLIVPVSIIYPINGLTLINPSNTCPLYVVQEKSPFHGKPVTFIPLEDGKDEILTSTDLNIKSSVNPITTPCDESQSLVWSLIKGGVPGVWFVIAGGEVSEVTQTTIHVDKFGTEDYVLSFCADICPGCPITCNKLGLFEAEDGYKHLAQNYQLQPFGVRFVRAQLISSK